MSIITNATEIIGQARDGALVISCDHASNRVPEAINNGDLGLGEPDMQRHIAYDVGAAGVSRHLAELLNAPLILSRFSRLVIDPNRGEDDPTLVMQLYDGTIIAANRGLGEDDLAARINQLHRPYHAAFAKLMAARKNPILIAIHSFTPQLAGHPKRPWQVGVLFVKEDQRLSTPLIDLLRAEDDICVGVNEPYDGHLPGDSVERHALLHNHPNILIELRNDLIGTDAQQRHWAERLAPLITQAISAANLT